MKNSAVLATKQDFNPFTLALKARCQAEGEVLVRMRNGDFCKVAYKAAKPEAFEEEAFHKVDHSGYWEQSGHSVTSAQFDLVEFESPNAPAPLLEGDALFKHVCWLNLQFTVGRYLISNAHGRWDGAEKALRHQELCTFYVAAVRGVETEDVRCDFEDDYKAVHLKTQALTDNLDEVIGFPLESAPDYEELGPKFFERFHQLALGVLVRP